jgi:hypothetical protein
MEVRIRLERALEHALQACERRLRPAWRVVEDSNPVKNEAFERRESQLGCHGIHNLIRACGWKQRPELAFYRRAHVLTDGRDTSVEVTVSARRHCQFDPRQRDRLLEHGPDDVDGRPDGVCFEIGGRCGGLEQREPLREGLVDGRRHKFGLRPKVMLLRASRDAGSVRDVDSGSSRITQVGQARDGCIQETRLRPRPSLCLRHPGELRHDGIVPPAKKQAS